MKSNVKKFCDQMKEATKAVKKYNRAWTILTMFPSTKLGRRNKNTRYFIDGKEI